METCIKLFHHSLFGAVNGDDDDDDGAGRKRKRNEERDGENGGRRINVELTYAIPFIRWARRLC